MLLHRILGRSVKPNTPEWNPDENQGKRKDQVDYSAALSFITVLLAVLFVIIAGIVYLINHF